MKALRCPLALLALLASLLLSSCQKQAIQPQISANPSTNAPWTADRDGHISFHCDRGSIATSGKFEANHPPRRFLGNRVPNQYGDQLLTLALSASNNLLDRNSCPMDLLIVEDNAGNLLEPTGVTEIRTHSKRGQSLFCFYRIPRHVLENTDYRVRFYQDRSACDIPPLLVTRDSPQHFQNTTRADTQP